jgi:hypothetical protein
MRYYGVQNEVKAYCNRLQSETSITVTPSLVKTLNDRVESLKKSGVWSQFGLGFNDNDADSYFQRASVNDVLGRAEVCWFVRGIKALGLWQNMVSWPLRSYQNTGTGSTAFSLGGLGTFNGTLVNSPTWGTDGLAFVATNTQRATTTAIINTLAVGAAYNTTNNSSDQTLISSRNGAAFFNGINLHASTNGNRAADIAGNDNLIRALLAPAVHGSYLFAQGTFTTPGTDTLTDTTLRRDKNARVTGSYVYGTGNPATQASALVLGGEGPTGAGRSLNGTISFAYAAIFRPLSTQQEGLYNLYKQTLGSNLSLP